MASQKEKKNEERDLIGWLWLVCSSERIRDFAARLILIKDYEVP